MWSTGINRNIVECKVNGEYYLDDSEDGINRNIVECKDDTRYPVLSEEVVLIETLWNVKLFH